MKIEIVRKNRIIWAEAIKLLLCRHSFVCVCECVCTCVAAPPVLKRSLLQVRKFFDTKSQSLRQSTGDRYALCMRAEGKAGYKKNTKIFTVTHTVEQSHTVLLLKATLLKHNQTTVLHNLCFFKHINTKEYAGMYTASAHRSHIFG